MTNIAIFASGNGSNCENIIRYFSNSTIININLVLSNKSNAYVIERAKKLNINTIIVNRQEFNNRNKVLDIMNTYKIDFIVLAGFLLMIPDWLIEAYKQRIINIHPSLLPKFGGKGMYGINVHQAVKKARENETGMTVHWVNNVCDGGEIIEQVKTVILPTDTITDIAEKEHKLEMKYFPQIIERIIEKILHLETTLRIY